MSYELLLGDPGPLSPHERSSFHLSFCLFYKAQIKVSFFSQCAFARSVEKIKDNKLYQIRKSYYTIYFIVLYGSVCTQEASEKMKDEEGETDEIKLKKHPHIRLSLT